MLAKNVLSSSNSTQSHNGLRLSLDEDGSLCSSQPINVQQRVAVINSLYYNLQTVEEDKRLSRFFAMKTQLDRQLTSLYLHNPYWSDFRVLSHFHKRKIQMTMEELQQFKQRSGLDNREKICNVLIRLAIDNGLQLNKRQISFIEKIKPECRDRDIRPTQPGQLLVYECLCGRGVAGIGRVYVHLFVDMFTGYAFARLGRQRTVSAALQALQEAVVPLYRSYSQSIQTIMHSTRIMNDIKELDRLETKETFSRLGLQWLPTRRKFGIAEKFEKMALREFFEGMKTKAVTFAVLQVAFEQWQKKYNSVHQFFARRDLLQL